MRAEVIDKFDKTQTELMIISELVLVRITCDITLTASFSINA